LLLVFLASCNKSEKTVNIGNDNKKFKQCKDHFATSLWELNPDWAASQGYHKLDSVLIVPNSDAFKK